MTSKGPCSSFISFFVASLLLGSILSLLASPCSGATPIFSKFVYQFPDSVCAEDYFTLDAQNGASCTGVNCTTDVVEVCDTAPWSIPSAGSYSILIYYNSLSDCQNQVSSAVSGQVWSNGYCGGSGRLMFTCDSSFIYFWSPCTASSPVATYPIGSCQPNTGSSGYFLGSCQNPGAPGASNPLSIPTPSSASSLSIVSSLFFLALFLSVIFF